MPTDYLITAANGMYTMVGRRSKPKTQELALAAARGCSALTLLTEDRAFFSDVERLQKFRMKYGPNDDELHISEVANTESFKSFLRIEKEILIWGGITRPLANEIIKQSENLLDQVRLGEISAQVLHSQIEFLKGRACAIAYSLEDSFQKEEERIRIHKEVKQVTYGMVGLAIISLNAAAFVGTVGWSQAVSVVSGILGSKLLENLTRLDRPNQD